MSGDVLVVYSPSGQVESYVSGRPLAVIQHIKADGTKRSTCNWCLIRFTSPAWRRRPLQILWSPVVSRYRAGWRNRSPAGTPWAPVNPLDLDSPTDCPPAEEQASCLRLEKPRAKSARLYVDSQMKAARFKNMMQQFPFVNNRYTLFLAQISRPPLTSKYVSLM